VSLLRISSSLLSFSLSLFSISLPFHLSLSLFSRPTLDFFSHVLSSLPSQRRCGSFFWVGTIFVTGNYAFTCNYGILHNQIQERLSLIIYERENWEREKKKIRVSINRGSKRRQTRCDAEWEEARLLEEGRNWGDDPPGERNPETRAKTLRFLSMTYPTCLCSCPFVPLSAPRPCSTQLPPSLSTRDVRCVPSRYSFVLPRLPSLVVLADGRFDPEERRLLGRWSPIGFFSLSLSIDPSTWDASIRNFVLYVFASRKISNEFWSIDYTSHRSNHWNFLHHFYKAPPVLQAMFMSNFEKFEWVLIVFLRPFESPHDFPKHFFVRFDNP